MKAFSQALHLELEQQLETIHRQIENPMQYSEQAMLILIAGLENLKSFFKRYKFKGRLEEMDSFRNIKPSFASRLIFYNEIYNIEFANPFGAVKSIRKFYNIELEKLKIYANENAKFYRYYKKKSLHFDAEYCIRASTI